jgi:cell division septum initiation protein DivIVA
MEADINAVRRTLQQREMEIEQRRYGVGLPARGYERTDDDMLLRWHVESQRYSDDITAMAQRQASEIVGEAKTQADQVRAEISSDLNAAAELAKLRRTVAILRHCLYNVRRYIDTADETLRPGHADHSPIDTETTAVQPAT